MNVVFSGSREGMSRKQKETLYDRMYTIAGGANSLANIQEAHHGVSGESDHTFHNVARALHFWIIGHPLSEPHLQKYRFDCICDEFRQMRPALDRNKAMVDEVRMTESGLLLATPLKDKLYRSGTYGTILCAFAVQLPFEIIQRNGEIRHEL